MNMEDMEEDTLELNDDHNHNYCPCSANVHSYLRRQLSDVPQPLPYSSSPVTGVQRGGGGGEQRGEPGCGGGAKLCSFGSTGGAKFMDSDSSSESSEVSETDCSPAAAATAAAAAGKFTLNSSSKFGKFP